jgi:DNA-binding CsgD family transcriptional regulator
MRSVVGASAAGRGLWGDTMRDHTPERRTSDEISTFSSSVEGLLRRLLQDLAANGLTSSVDSDSTVEETVLDVEVDGIRCLLIRRPSRPGSSELLELSPREYEIARMVAKGYANKTIASVLDISSWTVSSHLRRIYTKLGVGSRAAMVARLLDHSQNGRRPRVRKPPLGPAVAEEPLAELPQLAPAIGRQP